MSFFIALAAFVFVLGILVFIHEFGHYAVAKLCGVRVETFSLGFGKRLWGFRRGDTDYRISLLPLGGYVKMAGENPMDVHTGDPGEFSSHPRWQRFLIAIAGPAMNIIFAVVVLTGLYMFHHEFLAYARQPADIGWVAPGSAAEKAGIQLGDRIVKIENIENPNWTQLEIRTAINPDQAMPVLISRGGQILEKTVKPVQAGPDRIGDAGWGPPEVVGSVETGHPADKAGIRPGDEILSANDAPIKNTDQLLNLLQQNRDTAVALRLRRGNQELSLSVVPESLDTPSKSGTEKKYRLGFSPYMVEQLPFTAAVRETVFECKSNSLLVFELLGKLIERKVSPRAMSGPLGIAKMAGEVAQQWRWPPMLGLMAMISLQLAIFNLLPIPVLDGGLMFLLLIESLIRRDINQQVKERIYQVAVVCLMAFAAVVIFNDLAKTFSGG